MLALIRTNNRNYKIDLSKPLDISIPMKGDASNLSAWGRESPSIEPFKSGDSVYSVLNGAPVNFNDISFNPHAHVTHTECLGHITEEAESVNEKLSKYFFLAELITIAPEKYQDDFVISRKQLQYAFGNKKREALVIRTLPNLNEKMGRNYTGANPPYLLEQTAAFIVEKNITHLLVDLPSVDKEQDNGALLAHRAFWDLEGERRSHATITEFIYVPNDLQDGTYILNLQLAPFENDASPSRPVLYRLVED